MAKLKNQTQAPEPPPVLDDDIDLSAALPPGPPPPPKRGRGRPRSATPPAPKPRNPGRKVRKDKGIIKKPGNAATAPYIDINNILNSGVVVDDNSDKGELLTAKDIKAKMSVKEMKFISLYFTGDYSQIKAMKLAGYEAAQDSYLYLLAKKILEKYETQAGDHRIIARAMGAGEVLVFQTLLGLIKSKNERIRLDATVNLAKILGLTKEQVEGAGGITIIFEQPDAPGTLPPPPMPGEQPKAITYQAPNRLLQITR
jgi:hypothetical protein